MEYPSSRLRISTPCVTTSSIKGSTFILTEIEMDKENEHNYNNRLKEGVSSVYFNNLKSTINYKKDKNFFEFYYLDKLENPNFIYEGKLNFKPFFSSLRGNTNKINFSIC